MPATQPPGDGGDSGGGREVTSSLTRIKDIISILDFNPLSSFIAPPSCDLSYRVEESTTSPRPELN